MDADKDIQMKDDEVTLNSNLEVLKDVLISCQSAVDRLTTDKEPHPGRIEQDLTDCKVWTSSRHGASSPRDYPLIELALQDRLHLMELNSQRFKETAGLVDKVSNDLRTSPISSTNIESSWAEFANRWQVVKQSLGKSM